MLGSNENVFRGWLKTSLVRKVGTGLVAMAVLMLLAIGGVFLQVWQQWTDAAAINIAGRQRTHTQLIASSALRAVNGDAQAITDLQTTADLFDRSLQGLQNGDVELGLSPAPASVRSELDTVQELWEPTYQNVQTVLETTSPQGQVRTSALGLGDRSEALITASELVLIKLKVDKAPISTISFSQRLPISTKLVAKFIQQIEQGQLQVAPQLAEEIRRLDEVLYLLIYFDNTDDSPGREQIHAMEAAWRPFNADVQALLAAAEKGLEANQAIIASSNPLLEASERVVALFGQEAQSKVARLQQFLAGVTVIFLLVFGVVLWVTRRTILPLADMSQVAVRIVEGDLDAAVVVHSSDEIGRLARAFNTMTGRLREIIGTLVKRTQQLETVVEVSRRLSGILDLGDLMREVVTLTKETFNYYHVHIYLFAESGETLLMAEGYGQAGIEMKRQAHSIPLTASKSLVARAAREGRNIVAADVCDDPDWLPNPLLPDTRSEMAVPVRLDSEVVGVLDVQSEKVGGITQEDEVILHALANQIATAVRNARLFTETQDALYQAERLRKLYTGQAWEILSKTHSKIDYEYRQSGLPPLHETAIPEAVAALQQGQTVDMRLPVVERNVHGDGGASMSNESHSALATPLKLHDQIIGVLGIHNDDPDRQWTQDEIDLIEAVSEQMSLAIEYARLFEDTQRNAWRDQVLSESTAKVWSSDEIEEIMRTAVVQLGEKLRASEVIIRLGTEHELIQE